MARVIDYLPRLAELRDHKVPLRVHGNGFIQLDWTVEKRFNIWHPDVPRQNFPTPIHNHKFGFVSAVLKGRLVNLTMDVWLAAQGHFQLAAPVTRDGEDTVLEMTGVRVRVNQITAASCEEGSSYRMSPWEYHEAVVSEPTVTLLTKQSTLLGTPYVLVPHGYLPDNMFNRNNFSQSELWEIVSEIVGL